MTPELSVWPTEKDLKLRTFQKKRVYYRWTCNWKKGRKTCPDRMKIEGWAQGIVERNRDGHVEKHRRQAEKEAAAKQR